MTKFEEHLSALFDVSGIEAASVVGPRCVCPACLARRPSRHIPGPPGDTQGSIPPEEMGKID
jgi:hypothetical protein